MISGETPITENLKGSGAVWGSPIEFILNSNPGMETHRLQSSTALHSSRSHMLSETSLWATFIYCEVETKSHNFLCEHPQWPRCSGKEFRDSQAEAPRKQCSQAGCFSRAQECRDHTYLSSMRYSTVACGIHHRNKMQTLSAQLGDSREDTKPALSIYIHSSNPNLCSIQNRIQDT